MRCPHTKIGFIDKKGRFTRSRDASRDGKEILGPCGHCIVCCSNRAQEAGRIGTLAAKAAGLSNCCFITLTVGPEAYQSMWTTEQLKPEFQKFMKRLRFAVSKKFGQRFLFDSSLEYGETFWRVHAHIMIFGSSLDRDKWVVFKKSGKAGSQLYRSPLLDGLWSLGTVEVQDVTEKSAPYLARHFAREIRDPEAGLKHYCRLLDGHGFQQLTRERRFHSNRLGVSFLEQWYSDVFGGRGLRLDGRFVPVPKSIRDFEKRRTMQVEPVASTVSELRQRRILTHSRSAQEEEAQAKMLEPQFVEDNTPERVSTKVESLRLRLERRNVRVRSDVNE